MYILRNTELCETRCRCEEERQRGWDARAEAMEGEGYG